MLYFFWNTIFYFIFDLHISGKKMAVKKKRTTNRAFLFAMLAALSALMCGCEEDNAAPAVDPVTNARIEDMELLYVNEASGLLVESNDTAEIDYSNTDDGYIMARYTASTDSRILVQVQMPTDSYVCDIEPGIWATFPLSEGDGNYTFSVLEDVGDSRYAQVLSCTADVSLNNEFSPFLRSNQFVDYAAAPNTVATAGLLMTDDMETLDKVAAVYKFVISYLTYDTELAATVSSGYLPVLDEVLAKKSGICFDYAALMAGILRSGNIPCKLVIGYADGLYHAWISVWVDGEGWIDDVIYFNGTDWQMMDPTFASAGQSNGMSSYVGTGTNYDAKYYY